jgi:hypothetical protein
MNVLKLRTANLMTSIQFFTEVGIENSTDSVEPKLIRTRTGVGASKFQQFSNGTGGSICWGGFNRFFQPDMSEEATKFWLYELFHYMRYGGNVHNTHTEPRVGRIINAKVPNYKIVVQEKGRVFQILGKQLKLVGADSYTFSGGDAVVFRNTSRRRVTYPLNYTHSIPIYSDVI